MGITKITGKILAQTSADTFSTPLKGAKISFSDANGNASGIYALTDAAGQFSLFNSSNQQGYAKAFKDGFTPQTKQIGSDPLMFILKPVDPNADVILPSPLPAASAANNAYAVITGNKTYLWIGIGIAALIVAYLLFRSKK
jgi:hypothetical protein